MCGIAGIINFINPEEKEHTLRRMLGALRHRGSDAAGIYLNGPVGLAHTRLSIIDLNSGDQPIHNEDRTVWIVFNGEIFNYPELREDLIKKGHRFYTQTDTEVLVHLYEDKGIKMFHNLNGQFAIALWDVKDETLILARDRVGIRPLFYYHDKGRIIFGSETKALFADKKISREIDTQSLSDIFTCWTTIGPTTPFKNVYQIPPGHYAKVKKSGIEMKSYWGLDFKDREEKERSLSEWTEELTDLLYDAIRIRLRADVPVGAYLSGGIDSTLISAIVKKNFNNLLNTFSVSFSDKRFDESDFQSKVVHSLKTEHKDINCNDTDIGRVFPEVIWHTETPIFRTAPAPLYMLSKLVRENKFKVVLTGEGADEIFAGYNIFKEDKVRRFWARYPDSKIRPLLLEKLYPYIFQDSERSKRFLLNFFKKNLSDIDLPAYSHLLRWHNTSQLKVFFSDDLRKGAESLDVFISRFNSNLPPDFMSWEPISRAQYTEISIFLSNYLLSSQGDRMAMANTVEGRFPYLDHRVIEFACTIPARQRMSGLNEKYILKKAANGLIPSEVICRSKQPYRAPISRCFFSDQPIDYVDEMLSERAIEKYGYFDSQRVNRLAAKCRQQEGRLTSERENMALAGILSTQLVHHQFIEHFPAYPIVEPRDVKIFH